MSIPISFLTRIITKHSACYRLSIANYSNMEIKFINTITLFYLAIVYTYLISSEGLESLINNMSLSAALCSSLQDINKDQDLAQLIELATLYLINNHKPHPIIIDNYSSGKSTCVQHSLLASVR